MNNNLPTHTPIEELSPLCREYIHCLRYSFFMECSRLTKETTFEQSKYNVDIHNEMIFMVQTGELTPDKL